MKNKSANEQKEEGDVIEHKEESDVSDSDDDSDDDDDDTDADDDDITEKFSALYGEGFKNSAEVADYMADKNFRHIPEFIQSQRKILAFKEVS